MTHEQIDFIRWAVPIAVPAIAGFLGVVTGAWLTRRHDKHQRRLDFVEKQLRDFYSPMLGLRNEIAMRSNLRERIRNITDIVWRELCAQSKEESPERLGELLKTRGPEFTSLIEYDNSQLREELIPAYQQMVKLFRDNYWLAYPETRAYYQELIEIVELWNRWLAKFIPPEVVQRLGNTEERLDPFYAHLVEKHDSLRSCIERGDV